MFYSWTIRDASEVGMSIGELLLASALALPTGAVATAATLEMGPPLGVSWGPTYGFPPHGAEAFVPRARAIGASFARITLYWSQLEPKRGWRRWDELDAYLAQLTDPEEGFVTIASASPWATRVPSQVFPSSPAKNPADYDEFVRAVVAHSAGRVRYFQSDGEPNNAFFWNGSADDYAAQQKVFYRAVKDADPKAVVVLGACDGLFDPTGAHPLPGQAADLAFFATVIAAAATAFDVFDLRVYADPYTIPDRVRTIREMIRRTGGDKPIIASEYNGPGFFEFAANRRWASALMNPATAADALKGLVDSIDTLPVETRMFLPEAPTADAAQLQALAADDLVIRNVIALSSGVQKTAYFDLWHERGTAPIANDLLFGSFRLMDREGNRLMARPPLATAFSRLAAFLHGARTVERVSDEAHPDVFVFRVAFADAKARWVAWRRPSRPGEPVGPVTIAAPWRMQPSTRSDGPRTTESITVDARPRLIDE